MQQITIDEARYLPYFATFAIGLAQDYLARAGYPDAVTVPISIMIVMC